MITFNQTFDEQLDILSNGSINPFILKAKNDLDVKRAEQTEGPKQFQIIKE